MHEINVLVIPILGITMPLVLVPTILLLKQRAMRREWQHKERMKAIEMGEPATSVSTGGSVAAIGAGVPIAAVITATVTSLAVEPSSPGNEVAVFGIAWGCAFLISGLAMVTSLILAKIQGHARKETESLHAIRNGKSVFDPDAYDVVSSRG